MPNTERILLQNHRTHSGVAGASGFLVLFGLLFLGVGVAVIIGTLSGAMKTSDRNMPMFVPLAVGVSFAGAGFFVAVSGLVGLFQKRRRARFIAEHPDDPWHADHNWDITGATDHALGGVFRPFLLVAFLCVFLAPFNYLVFFNAKDPAPLFAKIIIGVGDAVLIGVLGYVLYRVGRYLKYGGSFLRFNAFPFFLGERVNAHFTAPDHVAGFRSMDVTLRCVEEKFEQQGPKNENVVRCYQLYGDTIRIEGAGRRPGDAEIPVAFDLPADGRSTTLCERPPVYWEVEIKADVPGIDYKANFLIPVYARQTNAEHVT